MSLKDRILSLIGSDIPLSGEYHGVYGYGDGYTDPLKKMTVGFVARIEKTQGRAFEGTIREDEKGIPEASTIDGLLKGQRIFFTKTYERRYEIDLEGTITAKEGPAYVQYEGRYDKSSDSFSGTWKIERWLTYESGRQVHDVVSGPWKMSRTKPI